MYLLLGQLAYTSFAKRGFRTLASAQVSIEIQQAFLHHIVSRYWDSYNPPPSGYRAVYLYQLSPEQTLFGWLYNDGADDIGRSDVPLFVCYYLQEPLFDFQLANIFTCLEKGPVALIERHNPSACLETKVIPNLWSYQPARHGIAIGLSVRQHSYFALRQGELLDIIVPVHEQETVIDLNGRTYEQQIATSIYTHYAIDSLGLDPTDLDDENTNNQTAAIQAYQSYKQKLQVYKQNLAKKNQKKYISKVNTRNLLVKQATSSLKPSLNQPNVINNTANVYKFYPKKPVTNISTSNLSPSLNTRTNSDSVKAYQRTQLLLKIGIAASVLALAFGIYGLRWASVSNSSNRNSISWVRNLVRANKLADVLNVGQSVLDTEVEAASLHVRSHSIIKATTTPTQRLRPNSAAI